MKKVSVLMILMAGVVLAASPHWKPRSEATCEPASSSVSGTSFSGNCSAGTAAGLGNGDLTFGVIATASADTFCHNQGNPALIVPGQNPAEAQFAELETIPGSAIKNGTVVIPAIDFSFSVATPTTEQAGCPSAYWSVTVGAVQWSAQYVVYQPFPQLVSGLSFNF